MTTQQIQQPEEHYHGHGVTSRRAGLRYQVRMGDRVIATCPDVSAAHLVADSVALVRRMVQNESKPNR